MGRQVRLALVRFESPAWRRDLTRRAAALGLSRTPTNSIATDPAARQSGLARRLRIGCFTVCLGIRPMRLQAIPQEDRYR
jgi:hypothetical protein